LGDHSCAEEGDLGYAKDNDSSSWVVHSGHLLDFGEGLSSARGITVLMRQRKMAEAKVTPLPARRAAEFMHRTSPRSRDVLGL
jgi:hypothetical protein